MYRYGDCTCADTPPIDFFLISDSLLKTSRTARRRAASERDALGRRRHQGRKGVGAARRSVRRTNRRTGSQARPHVPRHRRVSPRPVPGLRRFLLGPRPSKGLQQPARRSPRARRRTGASRAVGGCRRRPDGSIARPVPCSEIAAGSAKAPMSCRPGQDFPQPRQVSAQRFASVRAGQDVVGALRA